MALLHTFDISIIASGPSGDSRVSTTTNAVDAMAALHAALPAFPPVDQPDELEIRVKIAPSVDPNE